MGVVRPRWGALGGVAIAVACSSKPHTHTDAAPDVAIPDAALIVDAFVADAPPSISTGDPHTAVMCLRADAANVYWSSGVATGYVWKSPLGGGSATLLASEQGEDLCVKAVDATNVYFVDGAGSPFAVPIGGGSAQRCGSTGLGYMATNGQYVISEFYNTGTELWIEPVADVGAQGWIEYIGNPSVSNLAADAAYTYFTAETVVSGPYSIWRAPIGSDFNPSIESLYTVPTGYALGGGMPPSYPSQVPTSPYAVDAQNLYIVQQSTATGETQILQRAITGSSTPLTLVDHQTMLVDIAIDGSDVYWSALDGSSSATIQRVPIGGGSAVTVATATSGYFALGATFVAFSAAGVIYIVPK